MTCPSCQNDKALFLTADNRCSKCPPAEVKETAALVEYVPPRKYERHERKGLFVIEHEGLYYTTKRSDNKVKFVKFSLAHVFQYSAYARRTVKLLGYGTVMPLETSEGKTRAAHRAKIEKESK